MCCYEQAAKRLRVFQVYAELSDTSNLLPWEEGRISRRDIGKMGMFRRPILQLLHRDPSQRATARQFCRSITQIYERHTDTATRTTHTAATAPLPPDSDSGTELQPSHAYFT